MSLRRGTRQALACLVLTAGLSSAATAEPRLTLRVPPFENAVFSNFAAVVLPREGYRTLEVVIEDALAEMQPSTIRVTLNEMPMTPFVAVNMMPRGARAIVRLGASVNPAYSLRLEGENLLAFNVMDVSGMSYRAQFFLSVDSAAEAPRLAGLRGTRGATGITPPVQHAPPNVSIRSEWPATTRLRTLQLEADISDDEGLRRIVVEVNEKESEEIVLQNERPVRKRKGLIARGALPGEVSGDGRRLAIAVPVRLDADRTNVVAVRAENVLGLTSRAALTVTVLK